MESQEHQHMSLTTTQRRSLDLSGSIQGWGADLDPAVRPGVPRDKAPNIGVETLYPNIVRQVQNVRIHRSTEHMQMPPIFGTSCPPRGLSGLLRDLAYTHSEGQKTKHWLVLMLADRVDMIESIFIDLSHFRVPNLPKEMGLKAQWKYNKKSLAIKVAIAGALCIAGFALLKRSQSERQKN